MPADFSAQRILRRFAGFYLLALLLYWVPNIGIPSQPTDVWIHRLQLAPPAVQQVIPEGHRMMGGEAGNPVRLFFERYYPTHGRYMVLQPLLNHATARLAQVFGDGAWIWVDLFLQAGAVTFTSLLLTAWGASQGLMLLLCTGLYFTPVGNWNPWLYSTDGESYAIPFFTGALYLAWRGCNRLSAASMLIAVLMKENFAFHWPLILAIGGLKESRPRLSLKGALPHGAAISALLCFIVALRLLIPIHSHSYVELSSGLDFRTLLQQIDAYQRAMLACVFLTPIYFSKWVLFLGAALGGALLRICARRDASLWPALKPGGPAARYLGVSLFLMVAHATLYFGIGKDPGFFHFLPVNYEIALALGLLLTPAWPKLMICVRESRPAQLLVASGLLLAYGVPYNGDYLHIVWRLLALSVMAVLVCAPVALVERRMGARGMAAIAFLLFVVHFPRYDWYGLQESAWNREARTASLQVVERIAATAPRSAQVWIRIPPGWVEHAFHLETETLLLGRTDLSYHLYSDPEELRRQPGHIRDTVERFSQGRPDSAGPRMNLTLLPLPDRLMPRSAPLGVAAAELLTYRLGKAWRARYLEGVPLEFRYVWE